MNVEFNPDGLCLKRNQIVKVSGGLGHTIACDSGTVWVTQEGDLRDIILHAGESFTLDHRGPALVQAFEQGSISIGQAAPETRPSAPAPLQGRAKARVGLPHGAVGA